MSSSNTFVFSPEVAEVCEEAFERCGIDPASLTHKHVVSARRSLSYIFTRWSNKGVLLWAVKNATVNLVKDNPAPYNVGADCLAVLDVVIRAPNGNEYYINPIDREGYISIVKKDSAGIPSLYWFERLATPRLYLWPIINLNNYNLIYYYMQYLEQPGTAVNKLGFPQAWQEAVVSALAAKLAEKYAPEREAALLAKAEIAFKEAFTEFRERHAVSFCIGKYRGR